VHWECLLAKLSGTATHDSHYCSCLGHLGQCDTDRIVSIFCFTAQGGQGKYKCVAVMCHFAGIIVPTFADVNTALKLCTCTMSTDMSVSLRRPYFLVQSDRKVKRRVDKWSFDKMFWLYFRSNVKHL